MIKVMTHFLAPALAVCLLACAHANARPSGSIEISEISDEALKPVTDKFNELAESQSEIYFRINSFGGGVFAGLDFIQRIEDTKKHHPKLHVTCAVDTRAMSMGFVILQSDACDTRLMTTRSTLLAHNGSAGAEGTANSLESTANLLKALDAGIATIASHRLKISYDEYRARVNGQDWSMCSADALKVGAIDGLVDPKDIPAPLELPAPTESLFSL